MMEFKSWYIMSKIYVFKLISKIYSKTKCALTDVHVASVMLSLKVMKLMGYLLSAELQWQYCVIPTVVEL
jgi:hypothetical protein